MPLILALWGSSPLAKAARLEEHIRFAFEHRALPRIDSFLRNLPEDEWSHW